VAHYIEATGDTTFEEEIGLELLVETARLWRSLGCYNAVGQFRIDGVTGPDEYSALADNNVYTNLMAQHNLRSAAEAVKRYPRTASALGVDSDEATSWRDAADKMLIPYDERLGVTPQDEAFTEHEVWDFASTAPGQYPLFLHFSYFDLYRKQVIKQADLVLAMQLHSEAFTAEQKARNFAYYEPLTVRDSSLSATTQAVLAADVGQLQLAYDYLGEAALMDLHDLEHNVRDGVHIASLAGAWTVLVAGFGGMRLHDGLLSFAPRLPDEIARLAFHILFRGCHLRVEVTKTEATYRLRDGSALKVRHHGEEITLPVDGVVSRPIPAVQAGPRPTQPFGRAPVTRSVSRPG
jgi:alpha,alpha-trehalose phosphorylase